MQPMLNLVKGNLDALKGEAIVYARYKNRFKVKTKIEKRCAC